MQSVDANRSFEQVIKHIHRITRLKMLRDLASLAGGRFAGSLIAFVGYAHLARVLDPRYYGYVELATWIALLATMVIDAGLATIGTREISHAHDRAPELAANVPACQFLITLVVLPIAMILPLIMNQPWEGTFLIWIFCLGLLAYPWKLDWLFQGLEMMNVAGYFYAFRTAVFTIGVFLFVRSNGDFITVGWIELFAATAVVFYFGYFQFKHVGPIRLRFSWKFCRTYIPQGFVLGLSNMIWTAIQSMPVMFLAAFAGADETAWLAAPLRIVIALLTLSWIYLYNIYPTMVREFHRSPEAMNRLVVASMRVVSWGTLLGILPLALLSEPILKTLYGPKFHESVPVFEVLLWVLPITLISGHFRWSLTAAGKYSYVLHSHIVGLIAALLVGVILIPLFASFGAALTMLVSSSAILISSYIFSLTKLPGGASLDSMLLPTALAAILFMAVPQLGFNPWVSASIAAAIFVLAGALEPRLLRDIKSLAAAKS